MFGAQNTPSQSISGSGDANLTWLDQKPQQFKTPALYGGAIPEVFTEPPRERFEPAAGWRVTLPPERLFHFPNEG